MKLFHHPISSNARRAVMTAIHLQVPVELVLVDLKSGAQRTPEFLKMNPNGRVPVLEDEGFFLTESHAIMTYLADKTPDQRVYPKELRARADVNRWLFWSAHHLAPSVAILNWENVVKPMIGRGEADSTIVQYGEEKVRDAVRVLDGHLAGRSFVCGADLSLADLALATPLASIESARLPIREEKHLLAWFERVRALDAWTRTALPAARP